jgi:hypothetical protein
MRPSRRRELIRAGLAALAAGAVAFAFVYVIAARSDDDAGATAAAVAPAETSRTITAALVAGQTHGLGKAAGFAGRAATVYDRYYDHCKRYTYDALAFPAKVADDAAAAKLFAGPPRQFQPPAYRGCLAGLRAGVAFIDLRELKRQLAEEEEHED